MEKYPWRVEHISMTDKFYNNLKRHMNMRHTLGDITGSEADILILHIIHAIDNDDASFGLYLRTLGEAEEYTKEKLK